ncbi:hypothetical protein Cfor_08667 [Coptotermes formosanus]|uniref:BTB domain-containing protein n=1 Tax=Coptotermes formosanus TaxID=36987 RepID=A0A6L2PX98_COPFO|nr:hypothetical protein Cfor_08667 [Coptotermes formosanus]
MRWHRKHRKDNRSTEKSGDCEGVTDVKKIIKLFAMPAVGSFNTRRLSGSQGLYSLVSSSFISDAQSASFLEIFTVVQISRNECVQRYFHASFFKDASVDQVIVREMERNEWRSGRRNEQLHVADVFPSHYPAQWRAHDPLLPPEPRTLLHFFRSDQQDASEHTGALCSTQSHASIPPLQRGLKFFNYTQREYSFLCDVVLKTGVDSIHAHRVVLASVSPYFYAMFNDDMAEKLQNEVTLHDVDATALQQLVEYSYTGEILITEDNVQVLLPASSLLQISSVREACCKFLMRQLHPSNCLGIRSFADAHACKELHRRSHRFALQNFQEVMGTEEFLLLPFNEVQELISNSQLNISSEEKVFTAVMNWVKHDLATRQQHVAQLMRHVRLPLMARDFLMSYVDSEVLVRENAECKELLLEAMKYHLLPEQRSALTTERTMERRPEGMRPYLFAVGTYDGASDLASAESYSPQVNKWTAITPMGTKRSCLGTCNFDGLLYVCGGYDGASCLSSMERYDPLTGVWTSCPAMTTRRRYCRIAVVENCVYALGGFDSTNYQASVERFDPRMGRWFPVPSMSSRRSSCGVAPLDGALYCIGGNDGTMCMSSGERFNIRRNAWEPISSMHSRRSTHEVVEIEGCLYALGGNDGSSSLNSVERYDPKLNKWTLVTSMLTRRSSVGAAVLNCLNLEMGIAAAKNI